MQKIKIVKKPWGNELWFAVTKKYAGKILVIKKGHRSSMQYHKIKEESMLLDKGLLKLDIGKKPDKLKTIIVKQGMAFHLPPKTIHRMQALKDCRLLRSQHRSCQMLSVYKTIIIELQSKKVSSVRCKVKTINGKNNERYKIRD